MVNLWDGWFQYKMQFPIWSLPINSSSLAMGASEDRKTGNEKAGKKYFCQWLSSRKWELDVTSWPFPGGLAPLPHYYEIPYGKVHSGPWPTNVSKRLSKMKIP